MGRNNEAWAVFRCSLLSPLLQGEIPEAERGAYFRKLSQQKRLLPSGQYKRVSVRTLRRWWKQLREQGVQGTFRKRRSDRGQPHTGKDKTRLNMLERAVVLKREQPRRSAVVINRILSNEFGSMLPRSTLYRHLRREGATRTKLGISQQKIRCRWTRDEPGALWLGDFEHGPPVLHQGRAVETRLSAWIDCHSRYVVEARYYLKENLDILVDSLLRAWTHHGTSRELYVDNAKIYHATALKLACTELNIKLLHRPPRDPAPGGLIERFFQTLQGQLEAELRASRVVSLGDINRLLQAWLAQEYHRAVHSETGQTPRQRYEVEGRVQRQVQLNRIVELFHRREVRTVDRTHLDVTIDGMLFAVAPRFRGDRIEVRYDPFQALEQLQELQLYDLHTGAYLGVGRRYQREKGHHQQPIASESGPIEPRYLEALEAAQRAEHERLRQKGLDFQSASRRNVWSLSSFVTSLTRLIGRPGGLSSLSADELQALSTLHARHPELNEGLLRKAVSCADALSVPHVLLQLQFLLSHGDA